MAYLTKAQILAAADLPSQTVSVPEWGGEVFVQGLTGSQRDALEAATVSMKGKSAQVNLQNFRARLVAMTVVDPESRQRLFSDEDVLALGRKSAKALEHVFDVSRALSGLSEGDVEELTKKSEPAPNGASGSA